MPEVLEVKVKILDKMTKKMEMAGYRDRDIMAIQAVVAYEGVAHTDSRRLQIDKADLQKAIDTLDGKPVRILFDGYNPTGHGFDEDTQTFSKSVDSIGFIHWAYGETNEATGRLEAVADMVIWKKYYPEISQRLRQLHQSDELKFSFEMEREFEITPEGNKRLFNISFTGVAIVKNPAFEETRSLLVAELLNEGGTKNVEELKLLMAEMATKLATMQDVIGVEQAEKFGNSIKDLETKVSGVHAKLENAEAELVTLKGEVAEKDGTIKTIEAELSVFKASAETAEKVRVGVERNAKLVKYGEVKQTNDELAEMTKEQFVEVLEQAVSDFTPETATRFGVKYEKTNMSKTDRKAQLLGMVEGLSK